MLQPSCHKTRHLNYLSPRVLFVSLKLKRSLKALKAQLILMAPSNCSPRFGSGAFAYFIATSSYGHISDTWMVSELFFMPCWAEHTVKKHFSWAYAFDLNLASKGSDGRSLVGFKMCVWHFSTPSGEANYLGETEEWKHSAWSGQVM